jgi:general secretion pathway protein C
MATEGRFALPDGTARLLDGARIALQFALVIAIAFLVARAAWLLVAPSDAVSTLTPRPLPTPIQQTSRANVRGDLSLLMTTNLFEGSGVPDQAVPDAPETTLNLKLVALFMSTDTSADSATIVTPDNQSQRFQPGDEIIPGTQLLRILADRVIISRDGSEETLMRGGREAGLTVIGSPEDVPPSTGTGTTAVQAPRPAMFSPGVSARTLLASMDPVPEASNGIVQAFILRPRGNAQLMRDAGLEPGDRLVEINRTRVSELDTSALAAEFNSAQTVNVTVLREGEAQTLEINFEVG